MPTLYSEYIRVYHVNSHSPLAQQCWYVMMKLARELGVLRKLVDGKKQDL